jgi:hypothetical protein
MNNRIIVTNNPMLKGEVQVLEIIFVDQLSDVYLKSRDLVHQNWELISHPLAGSVKPGQNPYRSIILAQADKLDFYSLNIIEKSIQKLKQFNKNQKKKEYSKKIKDDYQLIDLTLIKSAFNS